jgi:hypothetical protein
MNKGNWHTLVCLAALLSVPVITAAQSMNPFLDPCNAEFEVAQLYNIGFDDNLVTSKVRAAINADPLTMTLAIEVETKGGNVVVTGTVPSVNVAAHLVELVASVEGVRNVQNKLRIANIS